MSKYLQEYKQQLSVRSTREPERSLAVGNNLFGNLARTTIPIPTRADFIPADNDGNVIDITGGNVDAQWLSLSSKAMQYWAYVFCSPLAAVIDRLAEAYTNGKIELRDEDGVTIKKSSWIKSPRSSRIMRLLKNPNPLQTWEEFNSEQKVLCKIFGYCPVFSICPVGMEKSHSSYLWNLNPYFCKPVLEESVDLRKPKSPIKYWTLDIFGKNYGEIPNTDILLIKDGFTTGINPGVLPLSKIAGLDYAVSNIIAAMEADNVLLKKKGPLGIFSYEPKPDMAGWQPMKPNDKTDLEKDLQKYGLSWEQLQYVVSKQPIKWNAMSFNLRDLMTKETVRQGIDMICDRFGYPAELMSGKNATYENRNSAEKFMYQNNVIPFSIRTTARYDQFFGLEDVNIYFDYNHLPVLQEDIVHAGQAAKAQSEALEIDWLGGKITWNEWRIAKNMDTVAGMDIYYPEYAKQNGIDLNPQKQKPNGENKS